jgi:hypothetical protein
MENVQKFREYAEECKRLAERAAAKDRSVLLEIADAWEKCAEEAERKFKKQQDGSGRDDVNAPS